MSLGAYLEGVAFFAVVFGATWTAALIAIRRTALPAGTPRTLGIAVLWLLGLVAAHILPGAVGLLGRVEVALTALAIVTGVYGLTRARPIPEPEPKAFPAPAAESGLSTWLLAGVLGGATGVLLVYFALADARVAPWHIDVVSIHLSTVAGWIREGTLWRVDDFVPDRSAGSYPATADVLFLSTMLPWRDDFLVRFVNVPLLAMTAHACYGLGRELRAPAATSALVAAAFVALPVVGWVAFATLADTMMLATFAAGCYFLLRHARTNAAADLVLTGLALGLSLGTRWYAVYAVAAVIGVWVAAWLVARRPWRRVLGGAAVLSGLALLAGGFWMARNLGISGNPFFPVKLELGGVTIFDAPRDVYRDAVGYSIADYAGDGDVWRRYLWPGYLGAMSWAAAALWAGLATAGVVGLSRMRGVAARGDAARVLGLVAAAAVIGVCFALTPYTAVGPEGEATFGYVNSRYVLPALVLGVAPLAWVLTAAGRWRVPLELAVVAAGFHGLWRMLELPRPDLHLLGLLAAAILCALVVALLAWLVPRARAGGRPALAAAAAVALLLVAIGRDQQVNFDAERYLGGDPAINAFRTNLPAGSRVGIVGEGWGNYPLFGPGWRNQVEYVGPRVDGTLRPYLDEAAFDRAVRAGRYDVMVVQDRYDLDPGLPRRQERWLRNDGYHLVGAGKAYALSTPLRIYIRAG